MALPLTGAAAYDVMGSTSPTDAAGHVGTLNSASLNANFSNRTVDAAVNISINNETWTGSANGVPIYRDQPNCGTRAAGSIDGFFAGANGNRAGMMYNLGGNQGAIVFRRRGG